MSHDGTVVYAVEDYFVDAQFLECVLILEVTWDLLGRSGGSKSTRKAHYDDGPSSTIHGHVYLLWWEAPVQIYPRYLVTYLDGSRFVVR